MRFISCNIQNLFKLFTKSNPNKTNKIGQENIESSSIQEKYYKFITQL